MRGVPSLITDTRKKVFTEVARLAYEGEDYTRIGELPYKIVPGDQAVHRTSIFLERAIVGERIRLAMGLPLQPVHEHMLISDNVEDSAVAEKYYEPPLINIIPYACNACPTKQYKVTEHCQNCLAQSCKKVCRKNAISTINGRSYIDPQKCIRCGKCEAACPYNAIVFLERPCQKACGMDAIGMDEHGRAEIDYDKCVSCGMCLVECPFGAIVDKGQIFQVIQAIKNKGKVIAIVAPAFVGQFGPAATPEKLASAMEVLGFDRTVEVAIGADMCTIDEAEDFIRKVPAEQPFMATSCCPSWAVMVKKLFPEYAGCISMALTPMVYTARLMKKEYPDCKVVFIGPCAAKKLEASRRRIRSDVDFVLTFEELQGMFEAKDIRFSELPDGKPFSDATAGGRGFAVGGGVAEAVKDVIARMDPDREVKMVFADGLRECRKMMTLAKAGKYDGYLLEGMNCPGGCVAGAGTIIPPEKAKAIVARYKAEAPLQNSQDSEYREIIEKLD